MHQKTLAILCYIDDTPNMIEEFGWLYRSWLYSGNWRTSDIVAVCNPNVIPKLPQDPGIVIIPREPMNVAGSIWADYPFINSIGCLVGEHTAHLAQRYTHILRTDADVFITSALNTFRPDFYAFGRGRYMHMTETQVLIREFAARHNMQHHGVFNCGHSMLGPADGVLKFVSEQARLSEVLLRDFGDNPGEWPKWWRGVVTMYAAELVANHYHHYVVDAYLNVLDFETDRHHSVDAGHIFHIQASHTDQYWSKFVQRNGGYAQMAPEEIDISCVKGYCHWLAITPTQVIKQLAQYPY